jgi:hypothetical protein
MTDITELLKAVAPDIDAQPTATTIDADVARGRAALVRDHRRRTIRRSMATASTIAAGVVIAVVATHLGAAPAHHNAAGAHAKTHTVTTNTHNAPTVKAHPHKRSPIKLIDYNGKQLSGFTVDKVPDGWFLSTSNQYALLIDPNGSTDNDPDAFIGKLAVLTQSSSVHHLPPGTPVTVNGQKGVVSDDGGYATTLTYSDPAGFGVVIQAPVALHWSDDQIVAFAEGVHVTSDALQGVG